MTKLQQIDTALARMIELLDLGYSGDWAATLERHRASLASDMAGTARRIHGMYGGMGSLNDIVLFKDGHVLHQENDEFNTLRARLYELLQ
jgi:hypothetical protein